MNKILWFDVETTGLDAKVNDITQLGGIVVIDGKEMETFDLRMQPFDWNTVEDSALKIQGRTINDLYQYPEPKEAYKEFIGIMDKYMGNGSWHDKFYLGAYNIGFDIGFLENWFLLNGNKGGLRKYTNFKKIDPMPLLHMYDFIGKINLHNYKLSTVCKHFDIELQAHDAVSDIRATRELMKIMVNYDGG